MTKKYYDVYRIVLCYRQGSRVNAISAQRLWSSGRIPRCHRGDPGSIPGKRIYFFVLHDL